jgi:hypothetical protein
MLTDAVCAKVMNNDGWDAAIHHTEMKPNLLSKGNAEAQN